MDSFEFHNALFVYGALMRDMERGSFLSKEKSKFLCPATTAGTLYLIGDFPGLVLDPPLITHTTLTVTEQSSLPQRTNGNEVCGEVFEIFDPRTFFETLDVIEGYWPGQTERSLFLRELISVKTENGRLEAWAYILNLPVDGLSQLG
jgi:gamma-glutamylcyclotransferase (GGCT)/AIG2-like uncharacterized protein YtfP